MSTIIERKPRLIHNAIPEQLKQAANSLTIGEWNQVVNILKQQTNLTTEYVEKLHRVLFGTWDANTSGYIEFTETINEGLVARMLEIFEEIKSAATLHVGADVPVGENVVLWIETED